MQLPFDQSSAPSTTAAKPVSSPYAGRVAAPGGDPETVIAIEQAWAACERRTAETLASQDPGWGTKTAPIADGHAVLCGPGLYVNRLLAAGLVADLGVTDVEQLEELSSSVGVAATVECCEATRPGTVDLLERRGYVAGGKTNALVLPTGVRQLAAAREVVDHVVIEVLEFSGVARWQQAAAEGWGHTDPAHRRASDAFALAAYHSDSPGLLLARDGTDGRVVGCATLRIEGPVATLGGMSTLPGERRRGVQTAMIRHRVAMALDARCSIVSSAAEPGSRSERNLVRCGFEHSHTKVAYSR